MAIDPLAAGVIRPDPTRPDTTGAETVAPLPTSHHHHGHGHKAAPAADAVVLSATTTSAASSDSAVPTGTLSPDALKAITEKLAAGAYNTPAVADRIAGNLISSGDITSSGA